MARNIGRRLPGVNRKNAVRRVQNEDFSSRSGRGGIWCRTLEVTTDCTACDGTANTADDRAAGTGNRVTDHGSANTADDGAAYGLLASRASGGAESGDGNDRKRGNFLQHGETLLFKRSIT
ncbi:hypothetical protein RHIZ404_220031 [Rhizobium sp. EC-SD404]|nr:hypothetical protein RHIZ404_220031 [Rhizobium sp. EC-SD404]